jgi:UPF0755 protein
MTLRNILMGLLLTLAIGIATVSAGYFWLTQHYLLTANSLSQDITLEIPRGTSGKQISQLLATKGIIRHAPAFRILSLITQKAPHFQAGEYQFSAYTTPQAVMDKLVKGEVVHYRITIPEGLSSVEILELLAKDSVLIKSADFYPPDEGTLLPETYQFTRGMTQTQLVQLLQTAQKNFLMQEWNQREAGLPFTSPQEAIILASIVEKETGIAQERSHIAGLYINRLKIGMPLQADPTVLYGLYGGNTAGKLLTRDDLKTENPYNTYLLRGLPAGAICNPGKDAIRAVLHPLPTADLYFVATGTGGHRFAETYDQHLLNVAVYRQQQKQTAITNAVNNAISAIRSPVQ